jgi:hypothetical protein
MAATERNLQERIARALERIANALERQGQPQASPYGMARASSEPRTFDQPLTRYVTSDPLPEGDWQLHDEGHEGEDKE